MNDDPSTTPDSAQPAQRRALVIVGAVLAVAIVVVAVALLVRGGDSNGDDAASGTTTTASTASTSTSSTPATNTSSTTSPDAAVTTGPNEPPADLSGAATTQVSVPYPNTPTAQLTAVRVGTHEGYVRVVFEFTGELPGYDIGYLNGPVTEDGSGDVVAVEGKRVISVRMTPASGVLLGNGSYTETYTGPDRIPGMGGAVTEVVEAGDFESQTTWAIGTTGGQRFKVSTLSNPTRLVVDVVNE